METARFLAKVVWRQRRKQQGCHYGSTQSHGHAVSHRSSPRCGYRRGGFDKGQVSDVSERQGHDRSGDRVSHGGGAGEDHKRSN